MANPLAQREWQMRRCQVGVDCQFIFVVSLSSGPLSVLWCPCPLLLSSSVVSLSSLVLSCPLLWCPCPLLLSSSVVSLSSSVVSLSSTAVNADDQARRSCRLYTSCIFIVSVLKKLHFLSLGSAVEGFQEAQELQGSETKGTDSRTQSWKCA